MLRHPSHNYTADLVTKHDNYGSVGLDTVAGCCGADQSCANSKDTGLAVFTIVAHEIGHCSSDSNDDHLPVRQNPCHGIMVSCLIGKMVLLQHNIYGRMF
jgi:hypothetical protein